MQQLKKLKFVILIIVVILVLVIIRNSDQNLFKQDIKSAIEATQNNSNLLSPDQLHQLKGSWMVVNIGTSDLPDSIHVEHSIKIPFENLLDQTNRKILEEVDGKLILYSGDVETASKAWVILNQMGFKNVFILNSGGNPEELKYKFQPDTTARLEQDSI
ncbi:MAG: rhodanese-like domain-containing protein [Prolixibacteraceae bacterium]|nr:rhodanese-like domain-containing protein [Prolixibacteraceae bacterium]